MQKTSLKQQLEKNNFIVKEPVGDLLVIEDFITKDEINDFFSIINNATEKDWSFLYMEGLKKFCIEKFGRDDVDNLVAEGKFEITKNWEDKNLEINGFAITKIVHDRLSNLVNEIDNSLSLNSFSFQRMQSGVELKSHTDQHTVPSIQYAAIIYLNDNYSGGEVFFKNKNLDLRPKAGSLLIFPGNEEFEHGVRHVQDGPIRYVIPAFIKVTYFYKENKY